MIEQQEAFDPATLEILWNRLVAACDEMAATIQRTAFSTVVREARDYACGLFDSRGNMLAQASDSTPGLLGSTFVSVKNVLRHYPPERLVPGDVLITNDPWLCTGHLLDITLVTPIFVGQRLAAFAVSVAHHCDIGGRAQSPEAAEVYEEGLFIPVLRLFKAGEPNEDLYSIIRNNVRVSDKVIGDVNSQLAANYIGMTRVREMLAEEGLDSLDELGAVIRTRSEQAMRAAIQAIPDGTYASVTMIDGFDESLKLELAINIRGSDMYLDYAGTSPQVNRGINCCLNFTTSHTMTGILCAVNPGVHINAGVFEPVRITAPEGCLVNPVRPAPVMGRTLVAHYFPYAVFAALSQAVPERVMAASSWPIWTQAFDGRDAGNRPYLVVQMLNGGMGARPGKDGIGALAFPGNISSTPTEMLESDVPVIVERKGLIPDSGGAGQYRGGSGQEFRIRVREGITSPMRVALKASHLSNPAFGLLGGQAGAAGTITRNGDTPLHHMKPHHLHPGDVVSFCLPGGGGYGDPLQRDPAAVQRDVSAGFVSAQAARREYGVVIGPGGAVDMAATLALRRSWLQGSAEPDER